MHYEEKTAIFGVEFGDINGDMCVSCHVNHRESLPFFYCFSLSVEYFTTKSAAFQYIFIRICCFSMSFVKNCGGGGGGENGKNC